MVEERLEASSDGTVNRGRDGRDQMFSTYSIIRLGQELYVILPRRFYSEYQSSWSVQLSTTC